MGDLWGAWEGACLHLHHCWIYLTAPQLTFVGPRQLRLMVHLCRERDFRVYFSGCSSWCRAKHDASFSCLFLNGQQLISSVGASSAERPVLPRQSWPEPQKKGRTLFMAKWLNFVCYGGLLVWKSAQNGESWSSGALLLGPYCFHLSFSLSNFPPRLLEVENHHADVHSAEGWCVSVHCTCAYSLLWYVTAFPCVTIVALCECVCGRGGGQLCKNRLLGIIKSAETDCTEPYTGGECAMLCGWGGGKKKKAEA